MLADLTGEGFNRASSQSDVHCAYWPQSHRSAAPCTVTVLFLVVDDRHLILLYNVGVVTPLSRKREIYSICQEYDIIVVEDDAYYYLQYPDLQGKTYQMGLCSVTKRRLECEFNTCCP